MNKLIRIFISALCLISLPTWAQEESTSLSDTETAVIGEPGNEGSMDYDWSRDPAAVPQALTAKRSYPGGADEEDLRVQTALPEAALKTDTRSVQREVYKALYNQELKDERHDPVEE